MGTWPAANGASGPVDTRSRAGARRSWPRSTATTSTSWASPSRRCWSWFRTSWADDPVFATLPDGGQARTIVIGRRWQRGVAFGTQSSVRCLPLPGLMMGFFTYLTGFGGRDMAVDLGTANTLVYVRGRGIVLSEPSVVAIDSRTGEVHAVGIEAKRMLGRTPGTIQAIRPLKDGVIADFDVTEEMVRHFIQKVHQNRWAHPRVVVCVPSGVTGVEKRAVEEASLPAGGRPAPPLQEALGAGDGSGGPRGGAARAPVRGGLGGRIRVGPVSLGGIVVSQSIRVGGDEMDEAIINYAKKEYKLLI